MRYTYNLKENVFDYIEKESGPKRLPVLKNVTLEL